MGGLWSELSLIDPTLKIEVNEFESYDENEDEEETSLKQVLLKIFLILIMSIQSISLNFGQGYISKFV